MKKSSLHLWLTRLAWGLLLLDLGLIFLVPADTSFGSLTLLLAYTCGLLSTLFVATTYLMLAYRQFFRSWLGWATPVTLLFVSNMTVTNILPISQPNLSLLFSILGVASLWLVGVGTAILLWYRDIGLGLIGWTLVSFLWISTFAWRYQGNLLELWLFGLNHPTEVQPLWWFNPLICVTGWVIVLGTLSFIGHTFRILIKELN